MTALALCRPLPPCRGNELPRSPILNCVLDGEAYASTSACVPWAASAPHATSPSDRAPQSAIRPALILDQHEHVDLLLQRRSGVRMIA